MFELRMITCHLNVNMIDTDKYQPDRLNMKFVTRSLCSLATKLHILARQVDIFGINQFTSIILPCLSDIIKYKPLTN